MIEPAFNLLISSDLNVSKHAGMRAKRNAIATYLFIRPSLLSKGYLTMSMRSTQINAFRSSDIATVSTDANILAYKRMKVARAWW